VLMQNAGAGSLGALTEEEVEDIFNAMVSLMKYFCWTL